MAVRFDAAADRLLRTANQPSQAGPWTVSFWFFPLSTTGFQTLMYLGNDAFSVYQDLYLNGTTVTLDIGATSDPGGTVAVNTWYHMILVRGEVTNRTDCYLDGATADPVVTAALTNNDRWEFGAATTANFDPFSARMAAIKWWSAAFSAAEREAERFCVLPRRFANLEGFYPLVQAAAADLPEDWSGLARPLTVGGTLTVEDGPPISWGSRTNWELFAAAVAAGQPTMRRWDGIPYLRPGSRYLALGS